MSLSYRSHEVVYHMGQFISRDSDVIKMRISKTPPIHYKNATIRGRGLKMDGQTKSPRRLSPLSPIVDPSPNTPNPSLTLGRL